MASGNGRPSAPSSTCPPPSSAEAPSPPTPTQPAISRTRSGMAAGAMFLAVSLLLAMVAYMAQHTASSLKGGKDAALLRLRQDGSSSYSDRMARESSADWEEAASSGKLSLKFEVENRYGTHVGMKTLYPWLKGRKLIEPHMDTWLRILKPSEGLVYTWVLYMGDEEVMQRTGWEVMVRLTDHGEYHIEVTATSTDDTKEIVAQEKVVAYCKYVRRELRTLLPEDRDAFFDAAFVLWNTSTEEGQMMYGPAFFDIDKFVGYHLTQASGLTCDHMHDGMGFFTQHAAMSIKFERAIQTVYPWVSLPYWDYTIDVEDIKRDYDEDYSEYWFKSDVFGHDMFGGVDPTTNNIANGRWAGLVVRDAMEGETMNGYGMMRAPWNANKDRGLKRYSTFCGIKHDSTYLSMPDCKIHYDLIAGYDSYEDFAWFLPYAPHGPVHVLIGGTFGCEEAYSKLSQLGVSEGAAKNMAIKSFVTLKNLYRAELLICPTGCSEDEDCTCYCDLDFDSLTTQEIREFLTVAVVKNEIAEELFQLDTDNQQAIVEALCSANTMDGDQLEAASPFDVSFWPIHPTIERVWQFKKLKGAFSDETWPTENTSIFGDDCTGHSEDSVIPLSGILEDIEGMVTNGEMYKAMDPSLSRLPYIFDDFTWSHCLDLDIDFSTLVPGEPIDDDSEVVN